MSKSYDVVIVGARCAGASLAIYLARAGVSVLLLEKSALPSDQVLSTHTVHPSGVAVIAELGLRGAMGRVTPEMRRIRMDWQGAVVDFDNGPGEGEFCPRRKRFDALLQAEAESAGVVLRDRARVIGLEWRDERVVGVRVAARGGEDERIAARIVVGADGRNSQVACWVGAESYLRYAAPRGLYWAYWPAPRGWGRDTPGMYLYRLGNTVRLAFHTDDDQVLACAAPLRDELAPFRAQPLGALRRALASDPLLGELSRGEPSEPVRGYTGEEYFARRAAGKGWLLLGDAGLHKDFLSGDGMSDALLQARSAAPAIVRALGDALPDRALERFWRQRDVDSLPLFFFAQDLADPAPCAALDRAVFSGLRDEPQYHPAFKGVFSRHTHPYASFPVSAILRWACKAAARGRPGALFQIPRGAPGVRARSWPSSPPGVACSTRASPRICR